MKITVVEDEPKTGNTCARDLASRPSWSTAVTGRDGLHRALEGDYDTVILDVMLPGLSGWEVLRACASARTPRCCS